MALPLTADARLLFATRSLRMFAYGSLSVVLVIYLEAIGLSTGQIGLLLTMTLLGDVALSLLLTTNADRLGRRRMLRIGAALMLGTGLAFSFATDYRVLLVVATVAVLSPSDKEVGPFLALEQAVLAQTCAADQRTRVFAWYHLVGSAAAALGALVIGWTGTLLGRAGVEGTGIYRPAIIFYVVAGFLLIVLFSRLSPGAEPSRARPKEDTQGTENAHGTQSRAVWFGLHQSRNSVLKLSALFSLDSFAGGFILQSLLAWWFRTRFDFNLAALGSLFFGANLLAAASSLVAAELARRFGLLRVIVFTHLPSNVLMLLIPLAPNAAIAVTLLLLRYSISQMDVPTRQSFTMAIVAEDERAAAAGITTVARSVGAALSPVLVGVLLDLGWINAPLYLAGGLKIIYDITLYRSFSALAEADSAARKD